MKLVSVNVSRARLLKVGKQEIQTGIFKTPVEGRVHVGELGLEGDEQVNLEYHGGPELAVYVYSADYYAIWSDELGRDDLTPGMFGENITVEGLDDEDVNVGDVFRIGEIRIQATSPRLPCSKLGAKMGDTGFPKRFLKSGRLGFYARVLETGTVAAGDDVERESVDPGGVRPVDIATLNGRPDDVEGLRRALSVEALASDWKKEFSKKLAKAEAAG